MNLWEYGRMKFLTGETWVYGLIPIATTPDRTAAGTATAAGLPEVRPWAALRTARLPDTPISRSTRLRLIPIFGTTAIRIHTLLRKPARRSTPATPTGTTTQYSTLRPLS